jgi:hypothetical protein
MSITADAIRFDFDQDIEYGQDQAYVSYPAVFPTVTFMLEDTQELMDGCAAVFGCTSGNSGNCRRRERRI